MFPIMLCSFADTAKPENKCGISYEQALKDPCVQLQQLQLDVNRPAAEMLVIASCLAMTAFLCRLALPSV